MSSWTLDGGATGDDGVPYISIFTLGRSINQPSPLYVDFKFERVTTEDYGVPHMWISTLGGELRGTTAPYMSTSALDRGIRGPTGVPYMLVSTLGRYGVTYM